MSFGSALHTIGCGSAMLSELNCSCLELSLHTIDCGSAMLSKLNCSRLELSLPCATADVAQARNKPKPMRLFVIPDIIFLLKALLF